MTDTPETVEQPPETPPKLDQEQFALDAAKWRREWISRIERAAYGAKITAEMLTMEAEAARVGSTTFNKYADPMSQIVWDLTRQIDELKSVFESYIELRFSTLYTDET
jgi:hypothetical protein